MIITKKKFQEMFELKYLSDVSYLLKKGSIVSNDSGKIDLEDKKNIKWIKTRESKLAKDSNTNQNNTSGTTQKTYDQLQLEIEALNQKLSSQNLAEKRAKLLDLRIAKESKEVIEVEVMEKVILLTLDTLFKNLCELPAIYAQDTSDIFKADKTPIETFVRYFTNKINLEIQNSLDIARNKAVKYYE